MAKSKSKKADDFEITKEEINTREKDKINKIIVENVKLKAKNDSQIRLLKSMKENQITICTGGSGSGKTICSIFMALSLLKDRNNKFQKIYLVKSVTTLKGEEVGFLKGDLNEKIDPFMESFLGNARKLFRNTNIKSLFDSSIISTLPLAFIRGINLDNCIVVLDETQNVSIDNARTLLTRIGEDCKIFCLGDTNQIDLRNKKDSSLEPLFSMFSNIDDIGCIEMNPDEENCRNPIIKVIESKFKEFTHGR
jgi:phosphate starvation-inducible PhoH-like protein